MQRKTKNGFIFKKDSIEVVISVQKFDKRQHRYRFYKDAKEQIELIDGKVYWGKDGGFPTIAYQSISVVVGRKKIVLPTSALANLFEPNLSIAEVNYDAGNDILYIQSSNGDGAGGYEVLWKIEKGVYKDRYSDQGF